MATTVDRRKGLFDGYARLSVALGGFLVLTYLACSIWDGLFPSQAMRGTWQDRLRVVVVGLVLPRARRVVRLRVLVRAGPAGRPLGTPGAPADTDP